MDVSTFNPPLADRLAKARMEVKKVLARTPAVIRWRRSVGTKRWSSAGGCPRCLRSEARRVYRLPTEAEWEYACRAGTTTRWYCGDDESELVDVAWFNKNAGRMTHPVGEKKPNAWGLHDMHGNVWQWCADWFSQDYYRESPSIDPTGPPSGSDHVLRGGTWFYLPSLGRSAFRNSTAFGGHGSMPGFRVVLEIAAKEGGKSAAPPQPKADGTRQTQSLPLHRP